MGAKKPNSLEQLSDSVRARIKAVAARFGLSELARRTGAPKANVHRYLHEGRVPTSFSAALVREFQVNPVWLLTGEGGMLRSEVGAPVAEIGSGLLDLVEAMNAVARMRIGALSGRRDQKALRELADAFSAFESLREKLNERTRPVLEATLAEIQPTLQAMDIERAGTLLRSASQLARMCLDDELLERLDMLLGMHAYMSGRVGEAAVFGRKVFGRRMRDGRIRGEPDLRSALEVAFQIRDSGRLREARRLLRAALCLDEDRATSPDHLRARQFCSSLSLELGDIASGLAEDADVYPRIAGHYPDSDMLHARTLLMNGACTWHEALAGRGPGTMKYRMLLRHACVLEDAELLSDGLRRFIGNPPDALPEDEYDTQLARLLLRLLRGRGGSVPDFERTLEEFPPRLASRPLVEVMTSLHRAQVARLAKDARALKHATQATERAWLAVPADQFPKIDWLLTHQRNLQSVRPQSADTKKALERVTKDAARLTQLGYLFLNPPS